MSDYSFDLTSLGDELERRMRSGDRRFEKYRVAIEEFESAASILRDLLACDASVRTLITIQEDAVARQTLGQALMTHAVLSYCRALVSETNNRRRINVDQKAYSAVMFKKHLAIKDLRSTAMAHYHKGKGPHGDIWINDRVTTRKVGGEFSAIEVFERTNFRAAAVHDLNDLLHLAIPYVTNEKSRRKERLDGIIRDALKSDPAFWDRLRDHVFDPHKFFRDHPPAIEAYWSDDIAAEGEYWNALP